MERISLSAAARSVLQALGRTAALAGAKDKIRSTMSEQTSNLSVLRTRGDFTTKYVNNLTEGADKLVLADLNEESAKLLSLQTRQQLRVQALSLAKNTITSILRLFQ